MAFKNKKGWFSILIIVVMLVFAFGLISMFVGKAFSSINDMIQDDNDLSNSSKAISGDLENRYSSIMDGAFGLVLVLLFVLCLFVSYQSANSPFLKVVAIVMMIVLVAASIILGSVYEGISEDNELGTDFSQYRFAHWVLSNFGLVSLIIIAGMIAMMGVGNRYA